MRAGLFGGTFNPIHKGHLKVVEQVLHRFGLDRLYLIPCRIPPHKAPAYLAPAADRVRMIRLALPADRRIHLSEVEIRRTGFSYTIDTVTHFSLRIVPGADLFLVMGLDAFLDIHTWKQFNRLLETVHPTVVNRRIGDAPGAVEDHCRMDAYIHSRLSPEYRISEDRHCWQRKGSGDIHLLQMPPVDISSSQIRHLIGHGKPAVDLVPEAVWGYIEQKELYR